MHCSFGFLQPSGSKTLRRERQGHLVDGSLLAKRMTVVTIKTETILFVRALMGRGGLNLYD